MSNGPAAALRRAGAAATGAARVDPAGIHDQDLLQTQVQAPAVSEVVVVDELVDALYIALEPWSWHCLAIAPLDPED